MTDTVIAPAAAPAPKSGGRKAAIGGGAAAVLALAGGGAFAWSQFSGGGTQPHDVLPADTFAYARIDLDPSASQKIALLKLVRQVPELADELGIDDPEQDLRKLIVEDVFSDCDVDWADDVEPWLGERVGFGLTPADDEPGVLIAVQVTDQSAAESGIAKLFGCGDDEYGIDFVDGYAILAPTQDEVDDAVAATEKESLADSEDFAADLDDLGDPGIVSLWGNFRALEQYVDEIDPDGTLGFEEAIAQTSSIALALRAGDTSLEIGGIARGDVPDAPDGRSLADLPADTVLALGFAGIGDQVADGWDAFVQGFESAAALAGDPFGTGGSSAADLFGEDFTEGLTQEEIEQFEEYFAEEDFTGPSLDDILAELEESYGFVLPEDLETLFGKSLQLYIGSTGLSRAPFINSPDDVAQLSAGLVLTTDSPDAGDLADRIVAAIADLIGIELESVTTDDGAVIATNTDVAEALASEGKLGDSDAFSSVIIDDGDGFGGFFLDVSAIIEQLREADPPADVEEFLDDLSIVKAIGASSSRTSDELIEFALKVAFTKSDD